MGFTDRSHPATTSTFLLDKYEVTVGRFRLFVRAVVGGWRPTAGAGVHGHLNGGRGLNAIGGGYEGGWNPGWTSQLATTEDGWNANLQCSPEFETWTLQPGANESLPINCLDWYDAYAFCIWDGGFLPSEAEWNYAASGGSEQREYPWSVPATDSSLDCSFADYAAAAPGSCGGRPNVVGGRPKGDGKWGHADLAGNVREWVLDWESKYVTPCVDCVSVGDSGATQRALRGGAFDLVNVYASLREFDEPADHVYAKDNGVRCARSP